MSRLDERRPETIEPPEDDPAGDRIVKVCSCGDCLRCEMRIMRRRTLWRRALARAGHLPEARPE